MNNYYYFVYKGRKTDIFENYNIALAYCIKYQAKRLKFLTKSSAINHMKSYYQIFGHDEIRFNKLTNKDINEILRDYHKNKYVKKNNSKLIIYKPNPLLIKKVKKELEIKSLNDEFIKINKDFENYKKEIEEKVLKIRFKIINLQDEVNVINKNLNCNNSNSDNSDDSNTSNSSDDSNSSNNSDDDNNF